MLLPTPAVSTSTLPKYFSLKVFFPPQVVFSPLLLFLASGRFLPSLPLPPPDTLSLRREVLQPNPSVSTLILPFNQSTSHLVTLLITSGPISQPSTQAPNLPFIQP